MHMQTEVGIIDIERFSGIEGAFVNGMQVLADPACHPVYDDDTLRQVSAVLYRDKSALLPP